MKIEEIKASGLIESYVLDLLSTDERRQVEGYLSQFPELRNELIEIQLAMQAYAKATAIVPDAALENKVLEYVRKHGSQEVSNSSKDNSSDTNPSSSGGLKFLSALLFIGLLSALWFAFDKDSSYQSLQSNYAILKNDCDSISTENERKAELFKSVNSPDANILNLTPTPKYPDTKLLFYLNPVSKQNYIQAQNLPEIAANEAYQLWSLKAGQDPIPLTVFKSGEEVLIPVDFEEGTGTYAITIEDEAGALSPNLDKLIGTMTI